MSDKLRKNREHRLDNRQGNVVLWWQSRQYASVTPKNIVFHLRLINLNVYLCFLILVAFCASIWRPAFFMPLMIVIVLNCFLAENALFFSQWYGHNVGNIVGGGAKTVWRSYIRNLTEESQMQTACLIVNWCVFQRIFCRCQIMLFTLAKTRMILYSSLALHNSIFCVLTSASRFGALVSVFDSLRAIVISFVYLKNERIN